MPCCTHCVLLETGGVLLLSGKKTFSVLYPLEKEALMSSSGHSFKWRNWKFFDTPIIFLTFEGWKWVRGM